MTPSIQQTPSGLRVHIGVFGRTNSGKSSLINAIVGQDVSIVSDQAGTTTDPVFKPVELAPVGPCLWIDTAGFGDTGALGEERMKRTKEAAQMCDIAVILCDESPAEAELVAFFQNRHIPLIPVVSHMDEEGRAEVFENVCARFRSYGKADGGEASSEEELNRVYPVSSRTREGIDELIRAVIQAAGSLPEPSVLHVPEGELVMLVMPQDKQAPKGRLILPQVSTIRALLDDHAMTMCVTPDQMEQALATLSEPPSLIITDSQVFDYVYERTPEGSRLTSFSVLFARMKGDLDTYVQGAYAIGELSGHAHILIAESCSHAPMDEDIGRVKIPRLMRARLGDGLTFDIKAGRDFPEDLTAYDLIIQCGGCMANRRLILSRIKRAEEQGVPITVYGMAIAYLKGILGRIDLS